MLFQALTMDWSFLN